MLKRNLVTSLLLYESVRTTKTRARVITPVIDRLVRIVKSHPPHAAIRFINRVITDKNASRKLMEVYKDRYKDRSSGLTSVKAAGYRKGDGAELVDVTLIGAETEQKVKESKEAKGTKESKVSKTSSS